MMNPLDHIGYAIIGTSDGFSAQTAGILAGKDIGTVVDLDNREIFTPFGTEILTGIRRQEGEDQITYFVLYRYALEMERNRKGAFYGSVVALKNCAADGFAIYSLLLELATNVKVYLDVESKRFLARFEDINFLPPDSLDEIIKSLEPINQTRPLSNDAFFTPMPRKARSLFKFIETFMTVEESHKVFASEDPEVAKLVENKRGLPIRPIQLVKAKVEKDLEHLDNLDREVFLKEKEIESIHHKINDIQNQIGLLSQQKKSIEQQLQHIKAENLQIENQQKSIGNLQTENSQLQQELQYLRQEKRLLEAQVTNQAEEKKKRKVKVSKKNNIQIHPITRLALLIFGVIFIGVTGIFLTQSNAKNGDAKMTTEQITPTQNLANLDILEEVVLKYYSVYEQAKHERLLGQLDPFRKSNDLIIQERAKKLQMKVMAIGIDHFAKEMAKSDSLSNHYFQALEHFEVMNSKYDSLMTYHAN